MLLFLLYFAICIFTNQYVYTDGWIRSASFSGSYPFVMKETKDGYGTVMIFQKGADKAMGVRVSFDGSVVDKKITWEIAGGSMFRGDMCSDGEFVFAMKSPHSSPTYFLIYKLSYESVLTRGVTWAYLLNTPSSGSKPYGIIELKDGSGYIITGIHDQCCSDTGTFVSRFDASTGTVLWKKRITNGGRGKHVIESRDLLTVVGDGYGFGTNVTVGKISQISYDGDLQRTTTLGFESQIQYISETNDGGYIACGYQSIGGTPEFITIKLDPNLNVTWIREYSNLVMCHGIYESSYERDGVTGYIAVGYYPSIGDPNVAYIHIHEDGEVGDVWRRFTTHSADYPPFSTPARDGGHYFAYFSRDNYVHASKVRFPNNLCGIYNTSHYSVMEDITHLGYNTDIREEYNISSAYFSVTDYSSSMNGIFTTYTNDSVGADAYQLTCWSCYGDAKNYYKACNSNPSSCSSPNICDCGDSCRPINITCDGKDPNKVDKSEICNGHGNCTNVDTCSCDDGYLGLYKWSYCTHSCYNVSSSSSSVCSSHGNCTGLDHCICQDDYYGEKCDVVECFGKYSNDTGNVCSGGGNCVSHDVCECRNPNFGNNCQSHVLCEDSKTICVLVDPSLEENCTSCHTTTIKDALNLIDSTGGWTIYLVGSGSMEIATVFNESAVISVGTPENVLLANTIKPYPGHSIIWENDDGKTNLYIQNYWWRISGEGGALQFKNPRTTHRNTRILRSSVGSFIMEHVEVKNDFYNIYIIMEVGGSSTNFKGYMVKGVKFFGLYCEDVMYLKVACSGVCTNTSFTDIYGARRRSWIVGNRFEMDQVYQVFLGDPIAFTIEGNYFRTTNLMPLIMASMSNRWFHDVYLFNNVIHYPPGSSCGWGQIFYYNYRKQGHFGEGSGTAIRIYNNLIVDHIGCIRSFVQHKRSNSGDGSSVPETELVYNNLIYSTKCVSVVDCHTYGYSVTNAKYQYNHQEKSGCGWSGRFSTCNSSTSILSDLGHNTVGSPILFNETGTIPYPFFELLRDFMGLPYNQRDEQYFVIPETDMKGRSRYENNIINQTSMGPLEYQCPQHCLDDSGNGTNKVDCQNGTDCGCIHPFFGSKSCEFSLEGCPCLEGECIGNPDNGDISCNCHDHYYEEFCNVTTCGGLWNNHTDTFSAICASHGTCSRHDECVCGDSNYTSIGTTCIWKCGEYYNNDQTRVCSGHGSCDGYNNCSCASGDYYGENCDMWTCHNKLTTDLGNVCGGHGYCVEKDVCFCHHGYSSIVPGGDCVDWRCGDYDKDDSEVCNERGSCNQAHKCLCTNDFKGPLCDTWSCGFDRKSKLTCSGHGKCEKPETCNCDSGFSGDVCQTNDVTIALLATFLPLGGIGFLFVVCCVIGCCCCLAIIASCLFVVLLMVGILQLFRLQKFGKLKNFEILLKEQQIEEDMTIAHLRINHRLFEIPYNEVKVDRMLGEGGSNSVVFRASWQNRVVAFKCFKTRLICSSQEKFDEFEREVEVLASVSHPNVIRFFGACMKPPRVGIIMEFCSNGDLVQFLSKIVETESMMFPLKGKIRVSEQVISAMNYLHSRNIIHRDLKLENVLIDGKENCKLMDFGLSTIVERMSQQKTTRIGTNLYMAPEVLTESKYTSKCDVFSFGVFLYILLTEMYEPYGKDTENVHIEVRVSNDPSFRPPLCVFDSLIPEEELGWVREVMISCWSHSASERPGFDELEKMFEQRVKEGVEKDWEYLEIVGKDRDFEIEIEELEERLFELTERLLGNE